MEKSTQQSTNAMELFSKILEENNLNPVAAQDAINNANKFNDRIHDLAHEMSLTQFEFMFALAVARSTFVDMNGAKYQNIEQFVRENLP